MILVTGGKGLIGSAVVKHLKDAKSYDFPEAVHPFYKNEKLYPDVDTLIDCARYSNPKDQIKLWDEIITRFKKQKGGRIILFSSIYGHKAPDFSIYKDNNVPETPLDYACWKGSVEQATRYLAQKLKPWNIQVNCIAPGGVLDKHQKTFQAEYEASGKAKMISTESLMPVIDMLLHPDNAVNGEVITVDGGWCL